MASPLQMYSNFVFFVRPNPKIGRKMAIGQQLF